MTDDLLIERDRLGPGVLEVTFNRPERRNAFTKAMYAQMRELWEETAADRSVGVVVLRGAGGKAFAAGNEISDFLEADAVDYENWIREMFERLWSLPQVTIAAIDGVCVGGGLAVATHCDLRVATTASKFGYPIARTLGNALSGTVLYRCQAVFGESLTREMLLASRLISADRASSVGALVASVADAAALDAEIASLVGGISQASRVTLEVTKQQLLTYAQALEASPEGEEARLREVYTGPDFNEGVRAFLAKEKPTFGR
ncbi:MULTISPECIES: enoyl-CoA hydratase-related protein [unclassified Nocardioides]|uniref:enoyl-CoA hydratase-related protein n=1 Tax=unclassified Nocardioides TaxID=2615069 RepID=UPI0006F70B14|nr:MULTISPECIES: enoyl-CoA hydratase-related protein [unclassified Nocardioides]KRA38529.1 enoyl-CoA hydratase [Nocardioides sp. Root614]KRA92489.1 enoyl-CoA hydratase [Nocardioides sp. Root682]